MSKFRPRRVRYVRGRIKALRERGLSYREIALKLRISERSAYRIKKDSGSNAGDSDSMVFFPTGSARPSKATKVFAVRCVGFGLPLSIVGWLVGVKPQTIARWRVSPKKVETDKKTT